MEPTLFDDGPNGEPGIHAGIESNGKHYRVTGRGITYPFTADGGTKELTYRPGISVRLALQTVEAGMDTVGMAPGVVISMVRVDRLKAASKRPIDETKAQEMANALEPSIKELNETTDPQEHQEKLRRVCFKLGVISVSIEGYIIDGFHRWEVFKALNLPYIACIVVDVLREEEAEDFNRLLEAVDSHREKLKQEAEAQKRRVKELEEKARKAEEEARRLKAQQLGQIDGSKQYHALSRTIAQGQRAFNIDDDYAYADLSPFTGAQTSLTVAPLNAEVSREYVMKMVGQLNDETADVLDILYHTWISSNPKHENQHIIVHADDIMEARGRRKQKGSKGRGGYSKENREKVQAHLEALDSLEIAGTRFSYKQNKQVPYRSRVISIMDREGDYGYRIVPGSIFAASSLGLDGSRQVAKLSMRIVNYDPYRQHWEKRIGRYFSWLWRAGQQNNAEANTVKVSTLLEVIGEEKQKPYQTRQALEQALDTLEEDGVIEFWDYEPGFKEDNLSGRGWFDRYKQCKLTVYAPKAILDGYAQIEGKRKPQNQSSRTSKKRQELKAARLESTGERLKRTVKEQGLSVRQAAEAIGISKDTVNRIMNGTKPTAKAAEKIEAWLAGKI